MYKKLLLGVMALALLLASCGQPTASPKPTELVPEPTYTVRLMWNSHKGRFGNSAHMEYPQR